MVIAKIINILIIINENTKTLIQNPARSMLSGMRKPGIHLTG